MKFMDEEEEANRGSKTYSEVSDEDELKKKVVRYGKLNDIQVCNLPTDGASLVLIPTL